MLQARPKSTTQTLNPKLPSKRLSITNLQYNTQQITLNNSNLAIPIYKGHFVNFHHEELKLDETVQLSGIEDGFAYIVLNEQIIQFYFYSPLQDDLNFYYNTDTKKYRFPLRVKEQKISHVEYITAVGFQCQDDLWTMAVASEFYIYLYTFTGDLDNFQMLKKGFNINGEVINQIKFHHDNLIYGGNLGTLTCKSIDSAQNYTIRLKEKIKKQFNRIFRDLTPWASNQGLIQLEILDDLHICFGLFEKYDKDENVDETYVIVYDIGLQGERFQELFTIKQSVLYNSSLDFKSNFNYQNLQFYHIHFQKQMQNVLMIITTKYQIQLQLQFEYDINLKQLKPEYIINSVKYPYLKIDSQIPYGVCLDESRIQYRQREALAVQLNQTLKSVFREEQLALFHLDNSLIAQFLDMAHLQYLKHMEQSISKYNSLLYRDTALEALEKIDLHGTNDHLVPKNIYQINRQTVNRIFSHCDINESQLYNLPDHFVCIADNSLEFLIRMRPIDCFFTAIKVTHYDFLEHVDLDFPLEKLVRAYGIEESCSQILQIIIQEDQIFYVNVELQHQYQLDLQKAYQRIHYSENIQKFFDDNEKIPVWVTGHVYTRKGQIIKEKALKAYFSLIKRSLMNEDRNQKSKKVQSTTTLIWKILAPLTTKTFINKQVYDLECNKSMENYSVQQLQIVFKQIDKLLKLFENEPNFYQKNKQQKIDQNDEMNQNQNYKNGFSKYIYETFEQSTRLDMSRSTTYSDQSLAVSINVDIEHKQMEGLYNYCVQIKQLLQFLIYFFGELQGIRSIINSFQNKQQLFELSIKSILCSEQNGLFTLKQLMIHIIKSDKSKFREIAQYMHHHFPEFFTIQDFKISLAQNLFDEILTFAAHKNLIKLNPNEQIHEKIKRILKLSKAPQITIDQVLEKREIFVYYKELQPELQEQLKEALKSVEEVIYAIPHSYLSQGFLNYMYPFATFKHYIQYLAQKCKHLEKDQSSDEFRDCFLDLIQQFNLLIQYYQNPPKGLNHNQVKEIFIDSLQVLNQYQNLKVTEVIANNLIKSQLKEFIAYIDYNQDLELQCNELEKLQMIKKQLLSKAGDKEILQLINLLIKLAQFNLSQNQEMSLEDIQIKLPLSKRLRYVTKAQEFIRIYQRNTHLVDISDLEHQTRELSKLIFLQDIMYDYVLINDGENQNYLNERRKILVELLDYKIILQFFQDNQIYFGQLICYDFIEEKENTQIINEQQLDELWIQYIINAYEDNQEWPSEVFKNQLKILLENFNNSKKFIRLEKITETIELVNSKICQDNQITQLTNWFLFEILLNHDVQQIDLLNIYLHHYLVSINAQENIIFERLQIQHLYTYKLQLIQQVLILFDALKKSKIQVGQQIIKFRNAFEDDFRYLLEDEQFNKQVIIQIKERIDKL